MTNLEMCFSHLDPVVVVMMVRRYGLKLVHIDGEMDTIEVEGAHAAVIDFEETITSLL